MNPGAIQFVKEKPKAKFAAFTLPVVVDPVERQMQFMDSTPVSGLRHVGRRQEGRIGGSRLTTPTRHFGNGLGLCRKRHKRTRPQSDVPVPKVTPIVTR